MVICFLVKALGLNALDMLRIEAGLIFAGYEFCDQTDPFEAGISFTVPLKTKEDDFSGKESLILRKNSPQRVLVGLELDGNEVALHGDGVYIGKQQIGIIEKWMGNRGYGFIRPFLNFSKPQNVNQKIFVHYSNNNDVRR